MSTASDAVSDVRPLLRRRSVLLTIAAFAIAIAIGAPLVLTSSTSTIFSVNAATGVVELRPLCADRVVWDLPLGEVEERGCQPENPADLTNPNALRAACSHGPEPVTVTLLAGATAKIEVTAENRWVMTLGTADMPGCSVRNDEPLLVSVGDDPVKFDPQGYFYRPQTTPEPARDEGKSGKEFVSGDGTANEVGKRASERPRGAANFALALEGRVIIGQAMQFGAGWAAAPTPILTSANVVARSRALGSGEPMTVMTEDVEAGTIIDTHAAESIAGPPGAADRIAQASGFVQIFDDELVAQVYRPESIGLLPYASETRIVRVSRWRPLWASPPVQFFVSVVVVAITVLSLVFAYYEAKQSMPKLLGPAPPRAVPPQTAAAAPATEPLDTTQPREDGQPQ